MAGFLNAQEKGGFDRSFDVNLNMKKGNMVYFISVVFLFLVSLAILDLIPFITKKMLVKTFPKTDISFI